MDKNVIEILDKCTRGKNLSYIEELKESINLFLQKRISNIRAKEFRRIEKEVAKYLKPGNYIKSVYREGIYKVHRMKDSSFVTCVTNRNTLFVVPFTHITSIYSNNKRLIHEVDLGRFKDK